MPRVWSRPRLVCPSRRARRSPRWDIECRTGRTGMRAGAVCAVLRGPDGTLMAGADPRRGAHAIAW
jgi:hypothetical protein